MCTGRHSDSRPRSVHRRTESLKVARVEDTVCALASASSGYPSSACCHSVRSLSYSAVLYGDNHNWFAAWAFWQLKIYGHEDVRIMDGGRKKWIAEGRELTTERSTFPPGSYKAHAPDRSLRAFLPEVQQAIKTSSAALVDVRSPQEFTGEILAPPGLPETCQRGGHTPGAKSIPWARACNDDGTFKSREELVELYGAQGITSDQPVIAYCRIGERSSHTWFVLKHLLGFPDVKNYDGSWTEWGNLVGAPVEKP